MTRKKRPVCLVLVGLLLLGAGLGALEVKSKTIDGVHITGGWMDVGDFPLRARKIMYDLDSYHVWGVRNMDGKDTHSAKFWVYFLDFAYTAPDDMSLNYSINMPYLFSKKERTMKFKVFRSPDGNMEFRLASQVPGVKSASLYLVSQVKEKIGFQLHIEFWPVVEKLVDMKIFDKDMEWRVQQLAKNMREYAHVPAAP